LCNFRARGRHGGLVTSKSSPGQATLDFLSEGWIRQLQFFDSAHNGGEGWPDFVRPEASDLCNYHTIPVTRELSRMTQLIVIRPLLASSGDWLHPVLRRAAPRHFCLARVTAHVVPARNIPCGPEGWARRQSSTACRWYPLPSQRTCPHCCGPLLWLRSKKNPGSAWDLGQLRKWALHIRHRQVVRGVA
jgi:hypothetical protein